MTLLEQYYKKIRNEGFIEDKAQIIAIDLLQKLHDKLIKNQQKNSLTKLFSSFIRPKNIQGLYFWGGVGRGKTFLMDTFYNNLPTKKKLRMHLHHFMQKVHLELKNLHHIKNPLVMVSKNIAKETKIICFDEFFVSDIADAMILANLLDALFSEGVTLVATSNIEPKNLYQNGLQRIRFIPAIKLIETHTQIINIDSNVDYRLRYLEQSDIYFYPIDIKTEQKLLKIFQNLSNKKHPTKKNTKILLQNRFVPCKKENLSIAWFTFEALCCGPRSPSDYIKLAMRFKKIILENVPQMNDDTNDQTKRFIHLVDELYDSHVKLIISSEVNIDQLYIKGYLLFEFQRTISRLKEMQSKDYFNDTL